MAVVKSNPTANLLQLKMRSVKYILKNCTLFLCYTPTVGKYMCFGVTVSCLQDKASI